MKLSWLLGMNVRKSDVIYVDIEGIAFTPKGVEAIIKNLRARNEELEDTNRRFARELARLREYTRASEETVWRRVPVH